MLNTPSRSNAKQYLLVNRAAELEEKLPITDDARVGLSSLAIGLTVALLVAAAIFVIQMI